MQDHDPTNTVPDLDAAGLELRRAVPADAVAVQELTRLAYAKWIPVIGREPLPMRADYDAALRKHLIDLLYVDGRLAALIETIPHPEHLLIENVAVLPALHGRGFGRRLMAHAETLAISLGLPEMRLYTNKAFATNIRFYRKLGYRVDREEPFEGGTTVYMSKLLGQSHPASDATHDSDERRDMNGVTDLSTLLATLEPEMSDAEFVFCSLPGIALEESLPFSPMGAFEEREGIPLNQQKVGGRNARPALQDGAEEDHPQRSFQSGGSGPHGRGRR